MMDTFSNRKFYFNALTNLSIINNGRHSKKSQEKRKAQEQKKGKGQPTFTLIGKAGNS